jgi:hypothetical protein
MTLRSIWAMGGAFFVSFFSLLKRKKRAAGHLTQEKAHRKPAGLPLKIVNLFQDDTNNHQAIPLNPSHHSPLVLVCDEDAAAWRL